MNTQNHETRPNASNHHTNEPKSINPSESEINAHIEGIMSQVYLPQSERPYHGIEHPYKVLAQVERLCDRVEHYHIDFDRVALRRAALLHDALGHLNPAMLDFESSEALTAHFAHRFLSSLGVAEEEAQEVRRIILATHYLYEPRTSNEIIMRSADLASLASEYEIYREANLAIHREAELDRNESIPIQEFVMKQLCFLRHFIWLNLELTPEARDERGASQWHKAVMNNLVRYVHEVFSEKVSPLPQVAELYSNDRPLGSVPDNAMYIALADSDQRRKALLSSLNDRESSSKIGFIIPGS
ncbi:MAG: HD domain-containing protein, partial [Bdellovibrionales bacterium]|nr:HD domain-containing protein [Bdellovibrionales bacterium]